MKQHAILVAMLAVVTPIGTAQAEKKPAYEYGVAPDWNGYRALGTEAVLAKMPDPAHWQVEWPNAYVKAGWGPRGRTPGYMTCGILRAIEPATDNRYFINFAIVVDHGAVKLIDIATRGNSPPNILCPALIKRGMLPPASTMSASTELSIQALGLLARVMPEGAYIASVIEGSIAERARLAPGMVVAAVNGIPLAGMGSAMGKLLASDAPALTLTIATGESITVRNSE